MNPKTHCFLFTRTNILLAQQIIQTNHATFEMAYTLTQSVDPIVPSIVLIGVPDKKSLLRVIEKLKSNQIDFSVFDEPDNDLGLTAVATVPLDQDQRAILQNYKLWNEALVSGQSARSGEHGHSSGCQSSASPDAALNQQLSHPCSSVVRASASQEDEGRLFESAHGYQDARVA